MNAITEQQPAKIKTMYDEPDVASLPEFLNTELAFVVILPIHTRIIHNASCIGLQCLIELYFVKYITFHRWMLYSLPFSQQQQQRLWW